MLIENDLDFVIGYIRQSIKDDSDPVALKQCILILAQEIAALKKNKRNENGKSNK